MTRRWRSGVVSMGALVALAAPVVVARADVDARVPTTLVAEPTVHYVTTPVVQPYLSSASYCVGFPYPWYCTPPVPVPGVFVSPGVGESMPAHVRLTTASGEPLADRVVRIVGRVTGTSCDVVTDAGGYAVVECSGSVTWTPAGIGVVTDLSWSVDAQGYDAYFDGDAGHAPSSASAGPPTAEYRP